MAAQAFAGTSEEYRLGPGDVVDVTVHGHDFGRTDFVVGADGEISFPYVGKVKVGDLAPYDAELALESALADGYLTEPQITLQVKEYRSHRVDVLGGVGKPGVYFLDGPTSLRSLVAKAGGAELDKSSGQVIITRGSEQLRFTLDGLQGPDGDFSIERGDVVDVTQGTFVYLTGQVAKPGAITYIDGMTASQALIKAGGNSGFGRLSGSYVLRNGERISVNLKRILKGKDADVRLEPGDQVVIPESPI
jgi:polysaccharide export outer membrane protein